MLLPLVQYLAINIESTEYSNFGRYVMVAVLLLLPPPPVALEVPVVVPLRFLLPPALHNKCRKCDTAFPVVSVLLLLLLRLLPETVPSGVGFNPLWFIAAVDAVVSARRCVVMIRRSEMDVTNG